MLYEKRQILIINQKCLIKKVSSNKTKHVEAEKNNCFKKLNDTNTKKTI